jgi:integrase
LVRTELLFALQRRDAAGSPIAPKFVRRITREVEDRTHLVGLNIKELSPIRNDGGNTDLDSYRRDIAHWLRVGYEQMTGVDPTQRLVWDFRTLDLRGSEGTQRRRTAGGQADFTVISQTWLRELTMERCRSYATSQKIRELLVAVEVASRALEATADGGHEVSALGPGHLEAITHAFRSWTHPDGRARSSTRRYVGLEAVFTLIDFGRRAGLMEGVSNAFVRDPSAHRLQLDHPAPEEVGKAIPEPVIAQLDAHLPLLECIADYPTWTKDQQRHMIRTLYIVLRDTGRRPREVCSLHDDCVEFDKDGPLLIWDNHKAGRQRRRVPITAQTADAVAQWREVRHTLRTGDRRDDYLFPAGAANRIDPYFRPASLARSLRAWVDSIPELLSDTVNARGQRLPLDRSLIHPYAFRHSYAQRHADAGVAIDVLRDLMDHRQISTTQTYYRVTLKRKREAVQTLRLHVADRHGASAPTSSNTAYEMRSVAAPFGNCVEPSNVKAGGGSCPIRFQCSGCGFYRPDPSYLPAIEDHILSLRADREIASAMDVDHFVLRNLDEQIASYQHVVDSMKARLAVLPADQQHEVEQAGALLRRIRAGAAASPVQLPVTARRPRSERP